MEYPPNPSQPFRIDTISSALIVLLVLATVQPMLVIVTSVLPFETGDAAWRVRTFALILGTAPQVAVCLVVMAALGLFSERYIAVRLAAIAAFALGVLIVPTLIMYWLDVLQIRQLVSLDVLRRFDFNALQTAFISALMAPALIWMGLRGLQAGKRAPRLSVEDSLLVNQEPAPGPLDPRVTN